MNGGFRQWYLYVVCLAYFSTTVVRKDGMELAMAVCGVGLVLDVMWCDCRPLAAAEGKQGN